MSMSKVPFKSQTPNPMNPNVIDVTVDDVFACKDKVSIVDVREPQEWIGEYGHIAEAKHIVLNTLPQNLPQISPDEVVVFVCRSGNRSAQATYFAKQNGYTDAFNMKGGMVEWTKKNLPTTGRAP